MSSIKLLLVGPSESGKTTVANFLSEQTDHLGSEESKRKYTATKGVRILEFERELRGASQQARSWGGGNDKVAIELWDCSGDQVYESCWPAIMKDADAVLIMYNPDKRGDEASVGLWYEWFVKNNGIPNERCLVFAHRAAASDRAAWPPKALQGVTVVDTNFEDPRVITVEFGNFVTEVCKKLPSDPLSQHD